MAKYIREPIAPQVQAPIPNQFPETFKRTRSGNAATSMRLSSNNEVVAKPAATATVEPGIPSENNKTRRLSAEKEVSPSSSDLFFLPNNKDFQEAIIAAVLGPTSKEAGKIEKRLKVFQHITLSLSPRA